MLYLTLANYRSIISYGRSLNSKSQMQLLSKMHSRLRLFVKVAVLVGNNVIKAILQLFTWSSKRKNFAKNYDSSEYHTHPKSRDPAPA